MPLYLTPLPQGYLNPGWPDFLFPHVFCFLKEKGNPNVYVETSDFFKPVWPTQNMSEGQFRSQGCQSVTSVMNHGELPSVASISPVVRLMLATWAQYLQILCIVV